MSNAITTIQHDASHQFRAAYAATTADRVATAASDLLPVNLDVQVAITTVLGAMPKLQSLRAELAATFPFDQVEPFEKAEKYARALAYAQTVYLAASAPTEVLPELVERATKYRDLLLSDAKALAHRGLIDGKPLAELRGGTGYLNNASDLGVLVRLLRERWDVIATKSAVQPAEIDEAEKIFEQITMAYAARSQHSAVVAEAADDRQRAFTLLLNAYDQVRRVVTYLRWETGDAERFAPSLWAGRGSRSANSEPAPKPDVQPLTPMPAPVVVVSTPPAPVGLPGSSPFAERTRCSALAIAVSLLPRVHRGRLDPHANEGRVLRRSRHIFLRRGSGHTGGGSSLAAKCAWSGGAAWAVGTPRVIRPRSAGKAYLMP